MGTHRIAFAIKTTNLKRFDVKPCYGILNPKETTVLAVSCETFNPASENLCGERITVEWTKIPRDASQEFSTSWFRDDGAVCRKIMPVEYNL